jgi:uncharacterized protein YdeI (YjbR/CyaY-like superfamily)
MEIFKDLNAIHAKTRKTWRSWLAKYHAKHKAVWVIFYRKSSSTKSMTYNDAVEEALCFGWIDSVVYKRDDESWYQYFSPRKPNSRWSKPNKERVNRMIDAGLMHASGTAIVELAIRSGTWNAFDHAHNDTMPEDLVNRFKRNKRALENFKAFPPSARRYALEWIAVAKRPETRKNRIEQTVMLAAKNIRVGP